MATRNSGKAGSEKFELTPEQAAEAVKEAALAHNLPLYQPASYKDPAVLDEMRALNADLMVMAYVIIFIPEEARTIPRFGSICFHPSLLPKHRGPSSINWAIITGATRTGLTYFWPDDGLDEGDILLQRDVYVGPDDTLVIPTTEPPPTATGVAMLAYLPAGEVEAILDRHGMAAYNEATLTDRNKFMERLTSVRRDGFAVVDGEYNRERLCISAPVFDHRRRPSASLTVVPQVASRAGTSTLNGVINGANESAHHLVAADHQRAHHARPRDLRREQTGRRVDNR